MIRAKGLDLSLYHVTPILHTVEKIPIQTPLIVLFATVADIFLFFFARTKKMNTHLAALSLASVNIR